MAGRRRTAKGGSTRWFPHYEMEATTLDALGAGAQATLVDIEIEDRGTGVAYMGGAIVSFRMWVDVKSEAILETAPELHVLIVPAGEGIPSMTTVGTLKQAEHLHWAMKKFTLTSGDPAATQLFAMLLEIKTARRFRQGDRFVVVVRNADDVVAFGAAAVGGVLLDAYVRPD